MITKYIIFANLITDKVDLSTNQRFDCGLSQIIYVPTMKAVVMARHVKKDEMSVLREQIVS